MTPTADRLLDSCEMLQKTMSKEIAGHEREWATRLSAALGHVEKSLRLHITDAEAPAGLFATEVDLTRPSLARTVSQLRRDHEDFSERAAALRKEVETAAQVFTRPKLAAQNANDLPEAAPGPGIADIGAVRQSVEAFLAALLQHRDQEAHIAIESVTTDLGAGD
jgi:hypothetical protein